MSTINTSELIEAVAARSGETKGAVERVFRALIAEVTQSLAIGMDVRLAGFGRLVPADRAEMKGRNPQTGEALTIAAKRVVKFKPHAPLQEALNPKPRVGGYRQQRRA